MCMEDVRLARESYAYGKRVSVANGNSQMVVPTGTLRYSLFITVQPAVTALVRFGSQALGTGVGIEVGTSGFTLLLDLQHHGALVNDSIIVESVGGATNVNVTYSELNKL